MGLAPEEVGEIRDLSRRGRHERPAEPEGDSGPSRTLGCRSISISRTARRFTSPGNSSTAAATRPKKFGGFGEPELGPITTGAGADSFYFIEDDGKRTPKMFGPFRTGSSFNLQTVPGVTEVPRSARSNSSRFRSGLRTCVAARSLALEEMRRSYNNSNVAQFIKNAQ